LSFATFWFSSFSSAPLEAASYRQQLAAFRFARQNVLLSSYAVFAVRAFRLHRHYCFSVAHRHAPLLFFFIFSRHYRQPLPVIAVFHQSAIAAVRVFIMSFSRWMAWPR